MQVNVTVFLQDESQLRLTSISKCKYWKELTLWKIYRSVIWFWVKFYFSLHRKD